MALSDKAKHIEHIAGMCRNAGNREFIIKGDEHNPNVIFVCLGNDWMYKADDTGNKYDQLIHDLMSLPQDRFRVEPCASVTGHGIYPITRA